MGTDFSEQVHLEQFSHNLQAISYYHVIRALSAVIYRDYSTAFRLCRDAVPLLPYVSSFYNVALHNFFCIPCPFARYWRQGTVSRRQGRSFLRVLEEKPGLAEGTQQRRVLQLWTSLSCNRGGAENGGRLYRRGPAALRRGAGAAKKA